MFDHFFLAAFAIGALSGCKTTWEIQNQNFFRFENKDIRITGLIKRLDEGEDPAELDIIYFRDEYQTAILSESHTVGGSATEEGLSEEFILPTREIRLGGTPDQYPKICAQFRVKDSNIEDWTRLGCLDAL